MRPRIGTRIEKLGSRLFGDPDQEQTIGRFESFFRQVGCPVRLKDIGLGETNRQEIVDLMNRNECNGKNPENRLENEDREKIVDLMLMV